MKNAEYFLGGASPDGFKTDFDKLIYSNGCYTYIIKGTAGSGKSTLMKKLALAFPDENVDIYYCSADPDSVDAVHFRDRNAVIVDGTDPHVFEPIYPGAAQRIVDVGAYLDSNILYDKRDSIISITDEYKQYHRRCRRYLSALSSITADLYQIGKCALSEEKLEGFADRISRRLLPRRQGSGSIGYRSLSAVTPKGYLTFVPKDCEIFLLNDDYFAGSDLFLRSFAEKSVKRGYDIIISRSYLHGSPLYRHIIIPDIKTAFITSDPLCKPEAQSCRPVNFRRFYSKAMLAEKKQRIKFDIKACRELLSEAEMSLVNAKNTHDILEGIYISAADFPSVNRLGYRLISDIKSKNG